MNDRSQPNSRSLPLLWPIKAPVACHHHIHWHPFWPNSPKTSRGVCIRFESWSGVFDWLILVRTTWQNIELGCAFLKHGLYPLVALQFLSIWSYLQQGAFMLLWYGFGSTFILSKDCWQPIVGWSCLVSPSVTDVQNIVSMLDKILSYLLWIVWGGIQNLWVFNTWPIP